MRLLKTDVEFAIFKMAQERKTATEMLARNANRSSKWPINIYLAMADDSLARADESLARAAESLANLAQ